MKGIEPSRPAWKAGVLPLNYTRNIPNLPHSYVAQNFIELDQGGADKFIEVLDNKYYEAYGWKVRLYKPGDVNEAWFSFTPSGEVYGFSEKSKYVIITAKSVAAAAATASMLPCQK